MALTGILDNEFYTKTTVIIVGSTLVHPLRILREVHFEDEAKLNAAADDPSLRHGPVHGAEGV